MRSAFAPDAYDEPGEHVGEIGFGSAPFSFQVSMSEAMQAQFSAPSS
jgi:hypothetical protein